MGQEENRTPQREEPRKEPPQEKAGKSSRLGKEAKIGVTVILLLLVVFGVVLVMRLGRSGPDEQIASAVEPDAGKHQPAAPPSSDPLFGDLKLKAVSSGPTVVPAKAAPTKPPKNFDSDLDRWKLAADKADKKESKRADSHGPELSLPPATLPDPPKPSHANRYEQYASDPPLGQELGAPKPLHEAADPLRLAAPSEEKPLRATSANSGSLVHKRAFSERAEASGYASASAEPPPAASLAGSSYADITDRPLPTPPAKPVSQYADSTYGREDTYRRADNDNRRMDNEYRRSSGYDDIEPRRPAARPSSYNSPTMPPRSDGKYEVQPNDSYWAISAKVYGTGAYFKALAELNRDSHGGEAGLKPGDLVSTPLVAQLEKSYPDLCPKPSRREVLQSRESTVSTRHSYRSGRTYTVAEGDTLFNIARYELGKASRWAEIYDLNRDTLGKDFNYITPGTQLVLPEGAKADVMAQPTNNGYRR
jgi:nucleoid-associated protein YgaU